MQLEYKPIKQKKIYEEVADAVIDSIKNGYLKPGDKLDSVAKLAENFRVSQSVIREALSGLRAMGLIHMRQGEGTYVTTYDASRFSLPVTTAFLMKKEDVKELFEVRRILEVRSEEHTSELQSRFDLVCRLLLEKKNNYKIK